MQKVLGSTPTTVTDLKNNNNKKCQYNDKIRQKMGVETSSEMSFISNVPDKWTVCNIVLLLLL